VAVDKKVTPLQTKDSVLLSRQEYLLSQSRIQSMREVLKRVKDLLDEHPEVMKGPEWAKRYAEIQLVLHEKTLAIEKLEWMERFLAVAKRYVEALCRVRDLDYDEGENEAFTLRMEAMAQAETDLFDTLATVLALNPLSYE
jgi:hypothetical protein